MIYIVETPNQIVVRHNYDIIERAAKAIDDIKILTESNYLKEDYKKGSIIITGALSHAFRLLLSRRRNGNKICVWVQGIIPEESYLRRKSNLRFFLLSLKEKYALKRASFLFFVSNEMRRHYERKYKLSFKNHMIFPCFNTGINLASFEESGKYENNTFVYAGGTAKWQNLDAIVEAYSIVESKLDNTKFLFLVNNKQYAQELIEKHSIKNYEIKYVPKELLPNELAKAKFGFILREDNAINHVSTPTKISTYLSCGIIPIFTESIRDFYNLMLNREFKIVFHRESFLDEVLKFKRIDKTKIRSEYLDIFNSYYSSSTYEQLIIKKLEKMQ